MIFMFTIDDFPIIFVLVHLYDTSGLGSRRMTPRTSCDLSVPCLVGPVHLPDPDLYDTDTLTRMAQPPVGLYHFLACSMPFFLLRLISFPSVLSRSILISDHFHPVLFLFASILQRSIRVLIPLMIS